MEENEPKNLGEFLKKEREAKKIELVEFSKISKISKKSLIDMENSEFSKIPPAYLELYLKKYAQILDLDYSDIKNKIPLVSLRAKNDTLITPVSKFALTPKILTSVTIIFLFFAISLYFIYQFQNLFGLPTLKIDNPKDDVIIVQSDNLDISGKTDREGILKINGKKIALEEDGGFKESVNIHGGLNIIKIEAINLQGRKNSITKMILKK